MNKSNSSGSSKSRIIIILLAVLVICVGIGAFFIGRATVCDCNTSSVDYRCLFERGNIESPVYVIGHKSPDTDTVGSAIAFAAFERAFGINCIPAVSGKINNETKFALEYFDIPIPEVLENAEDKNIVLVDHSTYTQTVDGMEKANVIAIIDHHGLGNVITASPLFIKDMPVGATATIVYTSFVENGIEIDKKTAGILFSAILSDTSNLTSSSATDLDKVACKRLAEIAEVKDIDAFYNELRARAESYDGMTDEEIFYSDYKEYDMSGRKVGIACVNATGNEKKAFCEKLMEFARQNYENQNMEDLYLLANDSHKNTSVLMFYGEGTEEIVKTAFGEITDGAVFFSPGVGRKSVIVPGLQNTYADQSGD